MPETYRKCFKATKLFQNYKEIPRCSPSLLNLQKPSKIIGDPISPVSEIIGREITDPLCIRTETSASIVQ